MLNRGGEPSTRGSLSPSTNTMEGSVMAWDANELEGLTEASPFLSTPRQNAVSGQSFEDPLAPSTVFAAREDREAFVAELEEEEVVDALPGYVLEETLRRIDDAEVESFVPF